MSLKVKVTRVKKWHLSTLLAGCVQFMFGKTSLASSFWVRVYERFAQCYRTVVCPVMSCLSVCNVGVLWQTVGWIKVKLGLQVGLSPGHIVLDGDPAPLPQRGTAPNFRPISVVAKWLDASRRHLVVTCGPSSPPQKRGIVPQIFCPCLLWPNGWMDQDATWYEGKLRPRPHCVRWGLSSP